MSTTTSTFTTTPQIEFTTCQFDANACRQEIAQNWKWLLAGGILTIICGIVALLAPVLATFAVETFIALSLVVVGGMNIAGTFFAPKGMRLEPLLVGIIQVLLAAVIGFYPVASLVSLTVVIAAVLMVEGVIRCTFAVATRELNGSGWRLASSMITVVLSGMIISGLPEAALWVIGMLVGVNMVSNGATQTAIAWAGRRIAKQTAEV
jgi:uncharacterized membrane protein HdeD (DUF308 family)